MRKPPEKAILTLKELSDGNLNAEVDRSDAKNEFGILTNSLHALAEKLKDVITEVSMNAADEIVTLAQLGLQLSKEAGDLLINTIPKIDNTAKLVQEISAASSEQNSGAGQVNNAIQQLNVITQQNASSSEELATSAIELAAQAEQLREVISFFNLKVTQAPK